VLERDDVAVVLDDGRRWLAASEERFDVIVSDLFVPWHAGAGSLYSREMYETVASRLAPGGLFCQWLPAYQLTREDFVVIARTFLDVFADAQLWRADFYPDRPVIGLVGRMVPGPVDLDAAHARVARLPRWARDPLLAAADGLAMLYAGDLHATDRLFDGAPINRDDRPVLEFLAPRMTRMTATGDRDWLIGPALASVYDALDTEMSTAFPGGAADHAVRAGAALYAYAVAAARHDDERSARLQADVRALVPDVIVAAEAEAAAAQDRAQLTRLRAEADDLRRDIELAERRLEERGAR
jgi:spermidine synthase